MKSLLSIAGALAIIAAATGTLAGQSNYVWSKAYATPEEAGRDRPPPSAGCLDAAGANVCSPVAIAEDGEKGLQWRAGWASADRETECVDRATADFRVDCDAPDAVRTLTRPGLRVCRRLPDGSRAECEERRPPDLPYRPTPQS